MQISRLLAEAFADEMASNGQGPVNSSAARLKRQIDALLMIQLGAALLGRRVVTVTAFEARSGELAGVAVVWPTLADAQAMEHVRLPAGASTATISPLAVEPRFRRRGLGRALLAAAEEAAAAAYDPPASLVALLVHSDNKPARQLYDSSRWTLDDTWVDAGWAARVERGQAGRPRRHLMLKPLNGAELPPLGPLPTEA